MIANKEEWDDLRWKTRSDWDKNDCPVFGAGYTFFGGEPGESNAYTYAARKYTSEINNIRVMCNIKHKEVMRGARINRSDYYRLWAGVMQPTTSGGTLRPQAQRLCAFFNTTPDRLWPEHFSAEGDYCREDFKKPEEECSLEELPESYPYIQEHVTSHVSAREQVISFIKNSGLDEQERFVMYRVYVLGQKYAKIAERMQRAASRVAQIHGSALKKIRAYANANSSLSTSTDKDKQVSQYVPVLEAHFAEQGIVAGVLVQWGSGAEQGRGTFLGCSVDKNARICACVTPGEGHVHRIYDKKTMATLRVLKA